MCLMYLQDGEIPKDKIGYKYVIKENNGYRPPFKGGLECYLGDGQVNRSSDEKLLTSSNSQQEEYESGFHICLSIEDVSRYLYDCVGCRCEQCKRTSRAVLVKVKFDKVVAIGRQSCYPNNIPCVVAKEMIILEEVEYVSSNRPKTNCIR